MEKETVTIFWFRRDLRLEDNRGLYHALKGKEKVLPLFIFDKHILSSLKKEDRRVSLIMQSLQNINKKLNPYKAKVALYYGTPEEVFQQITQKFNIRKVIANEDYEPYAKERDVRIKTYLNTKQITFEKYKDHVIFEKNEITKEDQTPYYVYTPYFKKWSSLLTQKQLEIVPSETLLGNLYTKAVHTLTLKDIGFEDSSISIEKINLTSDFITKYPKTRDFPSINTSSLSVPLRFGTISVRKAVQIALQEKDNTFLKELVWREFFMQFLWAHPTIEKNCFKPKYEKVPYINNESHFKKWCEGNTGFPLVDAGMKELNSTGLMHNRVRMITSSFLCKNLLIDWRWGERYFAEKLLDYEMASNVGNWQWVAGCGTDAAPYFRIFNPIEQVKKFDKEYIYIKKWIPNFDKNNYISPIIDYAESRKQCLSAYKMALENVSN